MSFKLRKWKKWVPMLSAACFTMVAGWANIENTYADGIFLTPNPTQSETQVDGQNESAEIQPYVQLIVENIRRSNSSGKEYFYRIRSYPKVSMPENPQAAEAINSYYRDQILSQSDEEAEQFIQSWVSDPETYDYDFSYEYTEEISCARADTSVLSFSIYCSDYEGGAHPGEGQKSENFDGQTGEHLSLSDVLTEDPLSSERLAALIANGMYADEEVYSMLYDTAEIPQNAKKLVEEGTNWYFTQDGMVFYFSPYAIAPYAAGIIEIKVPYAALSTIVKDQYLTPSTQFTQTSVQAEGSPEPYDTSASMTQETEHSDSSTQTSQVQQTSVSQSVGSADYSYMSQIYNVFQSKDLASMSASAQSEQANQIANQIAADPSANGCRVVFLDEMSAKTQTGNGIGLYLFLNEDGSWSSGYGWYYGHYTNGKRDGSGSLFWVKEPGSEFYFWLKDATWQNDTISGPISFSQYTYLNDRYVEAVFYGDYVNGRENGTIQMECNVDGCAYSFVWNSENGVRQQITPPEGFALPDGCYLASLGTSPDTANPRYYYGEPGRPYGIRTELYRKVETETAPSQVMDNSEMPTSIVETETTNGYEASAEQTQIQTTEQPAVMRAAFEQDYKGVTYTSFALSQGYDEQLYEGKTKLSIPCSKFVIWNDKIIYSDDASYMSAGSFFDKLYISDLDGNNEQIIEEQCDTYIPFIVASDGMLYYSQWVDFAKPTNIICYDLNFGQKAVITNGELQNLTEDTIYVATNLDGTDGIFEINRYNWSDWSKTGYELGQTRSIGAWIFDYVEENGDIIRWGLETNSVTERIAITDPPQINIGHQQVDKNPLIGRTDMGQWLATKYDTDGYYIMSQESKDWIKLPENSDLSDLIYNWLLENCVKYDINKTEQPIEKRQTDTNSGYVFYVNDNAVYLRYMCDYVQLKNDTSQYPSFSHVIVRFAPGEDPVVVGGMFVQG